jgi:Na+-translocating ferredoxin:NAD+ oxidoreductase RnfC subunit
MSANIRVDISKQIEVRIWLPSTELFTVAQASREELANRLREYGVSLVTLNIFPTSRIPITDDVPEQRVGLNIDA